MRVTIRQWHLGLEAHHHIRTILPPIRIKCREETTYRVLILHITSDTFSRSVGVALFASACYYRKNKESWLSIQEWYRSILINGNSDDRKGAFSRAHLICWEVWKQEHNRRILNRKWWSLRLESSRGSTFHCGLVSHYSGTPFDPG